MELLVWLLVCIYWYGVAFPFKNLTKNPQNNIAWYYWYTYINIIASIEYKKKQRIFYSCYAEPEILGTIIYFWINIEISNWSHFSYECHDQKEEKETYVWDSWKYLWFSLTWLFFKSITASRTELQMRKVLTVFSTRACVSVIIDYSWPLNHSRMKV